MHAANYNKQRQSVMKDENEGGKGKSERVRENAEIAVRARRRRIVLTRQRSLALQQAKVIRPTNGRKMIQDSWNWLNRKAKGFTGIRLTSAGHSLNRRLLDSNFPRESFWLKACRACGASAGLLRSKQRRLLMRFSHGDACDESKTDHEPTEQGKTPKTLKTFKQLE